MRTTFALDLSLRPVSVLAPKERPHTFKVGDVLHITEDYQYEYGPVPAGTKLFVSHVAEEDGAMWLLAEGDVPSLFHCDNMLVAMPFDCEDLLPCLRAEISSRKPVETVQPERNASSNIRSIGKLSLVACAALLSWSTARHFVHSYDYATNHQVVQIDTTQGTTQPAKY